MSDQYHPWSIPGRAKEAGVCPATLYNERKRGKLRFTKIGNRSVITDQDWKEYLSNNNRLPISELPEVGGHV